MISSICDKCSLAIQTKSMNSNSSILNVTICLLDETNYDIQIDVKNSIGDLFKKICEKLNLKEYDIFGLAQKQKNGYHFLNNEDKIIKLTCSSKQSLVKSSTFSSLSSFSLNASVSSACSTTSNLNHLAAKFIQNLNENILNFSFHSSNSYYFKQNYNSNKSSNDDILVTYKRIDSIKYVLNNNNNSKNKAKPQCVCDKSSQVKLYFRVKFYVSDFLQLRNSLTRHLYYLQLKQNYLNFNHKISEEKYFELASLALVADFGSFDPDVHTKHYFELSLYFPNWIVQKLGAEFIYKNMPSLHAQNSYMSSTSAKNKFIHQLSNEECPYNFHLYNLYKNKEETPGTIGLGIAPKGVLVFDLRNSNEIRLISVFNWSSVAKLNVNKKKFEIIISIDSKLRRYTYFTNCEKFSKYLFDLSRLTHVFTINIFDRLADQKTLANYVNESYTEKMQALNEGNLEETYEEREIDETKLSEKKDLNNNNLVSSKLSSLSPSVSSSSSLISNEIALCSNQSELLINSTSISNEKLCNCSLEFMRTKENSSPVTSSSSSTSSTTTTRTTTSFEANQDNKIENLTQLLKTQSFISKLNLDVNDTNNCNNNDTSSFLKNTENSINLKTINNNLLTETCHIDSKTDNTLNSANNTENQTKMAVNLHPPNQLAQFASFTASNNTNFYTDRQFNSNSDQLNYRQTFTAGSLSSPTSMTSNTFYPNSNSSTNLKLKRPYLPPPPLPPPPLSANFTPLASVTAKPYLSHTTSVDKLMYKHSNDPSNILSSSSSSSSASSNSRYSPSFNPPYIKYKKPPSYEESLRKMRKNSNQSSASSLFNEDSDSTGSKSSFNNNSTHEIKKLDTNQTDDNQMLVDNEPESTAHSNDNTIALSIENLEQIRMKAASMSLPLLTALCSDTSLIRSLNKTKQEGSF